MGQTALVVVLSGNPFNFSSSGGGGSIGRSSMGLRQKPPFPIVPPVHLRISELKHFRAQTFALIGLSLFVFLSQSSAAR